MFLISVIALFQQIGKSLIKILLSHKFWKDIETIVKATYPLLILLRIADKKKAGMDKLYFYMRRTSECLAKSKIYLDSMQKRFNENGNCNTSSGMTKAIAKYYTDSEALAADFCNEERVDARKKQFEEDENEASLSSDEEEDDDSLDDSGSDEESVGTSVDQTDVKEPHRWNVTLGDDLIEIWEKRKKVLETDLAIAGWMLNPDETVRNDVKENHRGSHRIAVEKVVRNWFGHEVILHAYIYIC